MENTATTVDARSNSIKIGLTAAATTAAAMFGLSGIAHADVHTVKTGDTVSALASSAGLTTDQVVKTNHLQNPDMIHVGDTLNLLTSDDQAANDAKADQNGSYTVKAGDTLSKIAQANGTTVDNIMSLNGLSSDVIYVGQVLQLTGQVQTQSPAQTYQQSVVQQQASDVNTQQSQATSDQSNYQSQDAGSYQSATPVASSNTNFGSSYTGSMNDNAAANWIAQRESGGSYTAQNGRYYGKYQLDLAYLGGDLSPQHQEEVASQYAQSRYGGWENAQLAWQSQGWW